MKIPKLKYYYLAMNPGEYQDFEKNRSILVNAKAVIDMETGRILNRQHLLLFASAAVADTQYRRSREYMGSVYVLRLPREVVDRSQLLSVGENAWQYGRSITVDHCGVDRFDLDTAAV